MRIYRSILTGLAGVLILFSAESARAQEYKIRQTNEVMGMSTESTVFVKGQRKRTEGSAMPGMANLVVIEQCDLKRTITLNTKKQAYFIEPMSGEDDFTGKDNKAATDDKNRKNAGATDLIAKDIKGGEIHIWLNAKDSGQRKKLFGFNARRILTDQKIAPRKNACSMKDSIMIRTEGWYVDLPQFNCPLENNSNLPAKQAKYDPECNDKYVNHRSGSGKPGFPLIEKRVIIMAQEKGKSSNMETILNTVDLTTGPLDSMLFEIPKGFKLAEKKEDLMQFDMNAMIKGEDKEKEIPKESPAEISIDLSGGGSGDDEVNAKEKGVIRIGVEAPYGDEQINPIREALQKHIVESMVGEKIESVPVEGLEEALKKNCDYILNTQITNVKSGTKLGGLVKAVKNADPNAASSYTIDYTMLLQVVANKDIKSKQSISDKYTGKLEDAMKKSMNDGCKAILSEIK